MMTGGQGAGDGGWGSPRGISSAYVSSILKAKGSHSKIPDGNGAIRYLRRVPELLNLHLETQGHNLPCPSLSLLSTYGLVPYPKARAKLSQWNPDPVTPLVKCPQLSPSQPALRTSSKVPSMAQNHLPPPPGCAAAPGMQGALSLWAVRGLRPLPRALAPDTYVVPRPSMTTPLTVP